MQNFIGIIPARYGSKRFEGKPLVDIAGKTMIQRVYEQAKQALGTVIVATDDNRIAKKVHSFGGIFVMTQPTHPSGTDRCWEAVNIFSSKTGTFFENIINIQGDEPFIRPEQIKILMKCFENRETQIATLIKSISTLEELLNPNVVKVIMNEKKKAQYFSRNPIPFVRNVPQNQWLANHTFFKHIGMYGYKYEILKQITQLKPSKWEVAESLEQLRWLENNFRISVEITELETISIDTPEDLILLLNKLSMNQL